MAPTIAGISVTAIVVALSIAAQSRAPFWEAGPAATAILLIPGTMFLGSLFAFPIAGALVLSIKWLMRRTRYADNLLAWTLAGPYRLRWCYGRLTCRARSHLCRLQRQEPPPVGAASDCEGIAMFAKKRFPLQQGDLDSLCMVYAVVNCLNRIGAIRTVAKAETTLHKIISGIQSDRNGDLAAAVTTGFDPVHEMSGESDVNWVASLATRRQFLGPPIQVDMSSFPDFMEQSTAGAILFFESKNDEKQNHYTFVMKSGDRERFDLWDSYAFKSLRLDAREVYVDDQPINLRFGWPTI